MSEERWCGTCGKALVPFELGPDCQTCWQWWQDNPPHSSPDRVELVELVVRRMYDDWPSRASSQALAEQAGIPVGEVIPYERTLEMGADHSGLRRLAKSAVAVICGDHIPPVDGGVGG